MFSQQQSYNATMPVVKVKGRFVIKLKMQKHVIFLNDNVQNSIISKKSHSYKFETAISYRGRIFVLLKLLLKDEVLHNHLKKKSIFCILYLITKCPLTLVTGMVAL